MSDLHTPEERLELKKAAREWCCRVHDKVWRDYRSSMAQDAFTAGAEWQAAQSQKVVDESKKGDE